MPLTKFHPSKPVHWIRRWKCVSRISFEVTCPQQKKLISVHHSTLDLMEIRFTTTIPFECLNWSKFNIQILDTFDRSWHSRNHKNSHMLLVWRWAPTRQPILMFSCFLKTFFRKEWPRKYASTCIELNQIFILNEVKFIIDKISEDDNWSISTNKFNKFQYI